MFYVGFTMATRFEMEVLLCVCVGKFTRVWHALFEN